MSDPTHLQDGNLDAENDMFCCGEPIWPKGKHPYRAEFSMSCGWVIVDHEGRESTLGYANEKQARDVAEKMTYAYWQGAYVHGKTRAGRDKLGAPTIQGEDCYIKARGTTGNLNYTAIISGFAAGPARTTMLLAHADLTRRGKLPTHVLRCESGQEVPIDKWEELQ
jgi:hypothetical protein